MKRSKPFRLEPPARLRERDVVKACLDLLRYRGYYPLRQQSGLFKTPDDRWIRIGEPGIPDYAALHELFPGVLVEVKRPGERPGGEQPGKILELRAGYRLAVAAVDSADALKAWLDLHEAAAAKRWHVRTHKADS